MGTPRSRRTRRHEARASHRRIAAAQNETRPARQKGRRPPSSSSNEIAPTASVASESLPGSLRAEAKGIVWNLVGQGPSAPVVVVGTCEPLTTERHKLSRRGRAVVTGQVAEEHEREL